MNDDGMVYPRPVTGNNSAGGSSSDAVDKNSHMRVSQSAGTGYVVSAPWRSSGKTLLTLGLARAAIRQSIPVQTFKKGPDYIDPLWLAAASGTGCYNLDPYVQCEDELVATYRSNIRSQSLALVEGTMGLHDGLCSEGSDSNAAIARLLDLPVILVVDCTGMHRTVAALINGIVQFDPSTRFAGIILNRIKSSRHEGKIRTAIDEYCDTQVIGAMPELPAIHIGEQELGLTPAPEFSQAGDPASQYSSTNHCPANLCIESAADMVFEHCDLELLYQGLLYQGLTPQAQNLLALKKPVKTAVSPRVAKTQAPAPLRIGIAKDEAFHFYYQDDLDTLKDKAVELIEISPIHDELPDNLDGLIIGGGFPERHAKALSDNHQFRGALLAAIQRGLVVHAECAGLMYLCRSLQLEHGNFDMVGCFGADVTMGKKPVGRGYVKLQAAGSEHSEGANTQGVIYAHEFHHSRVAFDEPRQFSYRVLRGHGIDGKSDGVRYKNAHAGYAHFRHTRSNPWLDAFLQRVCDVKDSCVVATDEIRKQLND